jgi:trk system potassium uptake protein TrkA
MNITIAGAGTVGYSLALGLSYKHNIIIVDKNIQKLNKIEENLDILTLHGNIEDPKTYNSFEMKELDLFIAVTDSDEANLLSTLIIEDVMDVKKKIIRLRNDYFLDSPILEKLRVDDVVFPDILTASKIEALFDFPKANNVKNFIYFAEKLVSVKVHYSDEMSYKVSDFISEHSIVVGIERDRKFFIPNFEEEIVEGDLIYLFGNDEVIKKFSSKLDCKMPQAIKRVVIFGANPVALKIAKSLIDKELDIKIIEKNREYCKIASELLQDKVTIINAPFEEHNLFETEKLKNADMIITASENDEKNIVKCIEARGFGIEKVVAINNDQAYYGLMHQLGIVVVRGAKVGAHYAILEKISSNSIINVRHFCGGAAVMFLRKIYENSQLIDKEIKPIKLKGIFIHQLRDEKIYSNGNICPLKAGDTLVVFAKTEDEDEIQKWIHTL